MVTKEEAQAVVDGMIDTLTDYYAWRGEFDVEPEGYVIALQTMCNCDEPGYNACIKVTLKESKRR